MKTTPPPYTRPPWTWSSDYRLLMGDQARNMCVVRLHTSFRIEPGDATLIETAPEILEALRETERNATWNDDDTVESLRARLDNLSEDARTTIAKATKGNG